MEERESANVGTKTEGMSLGTVNHSGLTVVPGYHPLHKSRKARCPVISVNPRGGGRPENIHIDLPADLSSSYFFPIIRAHIHMRIHIRVAGTGSSPQ